MPPRGRRAAVIPPAVIIAPMGMNTPFTTATTDQYKLLTDMVKTNPKLMWTSEAEAHQFMRGLESILNISPVLHTHWPSLIFMMVPGDFELHRTWIANNILTPALSWNAAKTAFISHFQRGDYLDGRRRLYSQCVQSNKETAQEYTQRFETLATQLGLADADQLSIQHYVDGLHQGIQRKLMMYKSHMRTIGPGGIIPNPSWDFTSLAATTRLAITYDNEWMSMQQQSSLPTHLRQSSLANPVHVSTSSSITPSEQGIEKKRKGKSSDTTSRDRYPKRTKTEFGEKKCQYHPYSTTHTTEECKTKGKGKRKEEAVGSIPPDLDVESSTSQQRDISRVRCFRCNNRGHYANNCPDSTPSTKSRKENKTKDGAKKTKARATSISTDHSSSTSMSLSSSAMTTTSSQPGGH